MAVYSVHLQEPVEVDRPLVLPSEKELIETAHNLFDRVSERYSGSDVPMYLVSNSVSVPLAVRSLKQRKDFFSGCMFVNPVFEF